MARALILVHVDDASRAHRIPGTVTPALEDRGYEVELANFVTGELPPPASDVDVLVVMGSAHAADDDELPWLAAELAYLRSAVEVGTPVFGICFGGQALARVLGGVVGRAPRPERGLTTIESLDGSVPAGPWMEFHYDAFTLPPGATPLARTDVALQAFSHGPHLGVQFHPEIGPDVFEAWVEGWDAEAWAEVERRIDVPAIRAALAERAPACAVACRALVDRFLAGTGQRAVAS